MEQTTNDSESPVATLIGAPAVAAGPVDAAGAAAIASAASAPPPFVLEPPPPDGMPVKRKRGRPPKAQQPGQAPARAPRRGGGHGPTKAELEARIKELEAKLPPADGGISPEQTTAKALAGSFDMIGRLVARFFGPHWVFDREECDLLGAAWAGPIAPLLSENSRYLPWITAAGLTFSVVAPRVDIEMQRRALVGKQEIVSAPRSITEVE